MALFFSLCSYHLFTKAQTTASEIPWAWGCLVAAILAVVGLPFHLQLRAKPCVMDKRYDHFRLGDKVACALSDIREVVVERIVGPHGSDGPRHVSYQVQLVLHSGREQYTYLVARGSSLAEEYARQLREFLQPTTP